MVNTRRSTIVRRAETNDALPVVQDSKKVKTYDANNNLVKEEPQNEKDQQDDKTKTEKSDGSELTAEEKLKKVRKPVSYELKNSDERFIPLPVLHKIFSNLTESHLIKEGILVNKYWNQQIFKAREKFESKSFRLDDDGGYFSYSYRNRHNHHFGLSGDKTEQERQLNEKKFYYMFGYLNNFGNLIENLSITGNNKNLDKKVIRSFVSNLEMVLCDQPGKVEEENSEVRASLSATSSTTFLPPDDGDVLHKNYQKISCYGEERIKLDVQEQKYAVVRKDFKLEQENEKLSKKQKESQGNWPWS